MARDGFNVNGLKEWQKALAQMGGPELDELKSRILRTAGLRTLEYVDDLTPVRSGRLKGSMSMGDKDNVFQVKVNRQVSEVLVGTNVSYAKYVNDGFQQKAGQFVPGYWDARGNFQYDRNADSGMVLTGKIVPGAHMFDKALDNLDDDLPAIVEYEFRRMYRRVFG